jgi:hypothetical protein
MNQFFVALSVGLSLLLGLFWLASFLWSNPSLTVTVW